MTPRLLLVGLAVALAACATDAPPATPPAADPVADDPAAEAAAVRDAVRDAVDAQERAVREADLPALDALWSADDDVVVFEQGGVDSTWAAYRDGHLGPELVALEDLDYRHEDVAVRVGGGLAVATGRYVLAARHDGEPVESEGLFTTVLERADGRWEIVHTHLSRPRRPSA